MIDAADMHRQSGAWYVYAHTFVVPEVPGGRTAARRVLEALRDTTASTTLCEIANKPELVQNTLLLTLCGRPLHTTTEGVRVVLRTLGSLDSDLALVVQVELKQQSLRISCVLWRSTRDHVLYWLKAFDSKWMRESNVLAASLLDASERRRDILTSWRSKR